MVDLPREPSNDDRKYRAIVVRRSASRKPHLRRSHRRTSRRANSTATLHQPVSLNAKAREHWASLPTEMKQFIAEREVQSQQKISELGQHARAARQINAVIDNYAAHLPEQERAIPREKHIELLYAANDALQQDPARAIQWLAQAHSVDLAELAGQAGRSKLILQQEAQGCCSRRNRHACASISSSNSGSKSNSNSKPWRNSCRTR